MTTPNVIYYDGFDSYTTTYSMSGRGWSFGGSAISFIAGRFGGQGFRNNNGSVATLTLPGGTYSSFTVGVAYRTGNLNAWTIVGLLNSGGSVCTLFLTATGAIQLVRGNTAGSNVLVQTPAMLGTNNWYFIELEFVRSATVGVANIYVNGALIAGASSLNTGASDINQLQFPSNAGSFPSLDYDDLHVVKVRIGERKVETVRPTADDVVTWVPNSGSNNYSRVADATYDGDTSYVASATVGAQDTYTPGSLASTPSHIDAVQINVLARKDDATTRQIATILKTPSSTTAGATQNLGSSYTNFVDVYELNPDTGLPWTASDVAALKIGQKVIS